MLQRFTTGTFKVLSLSFFLAAAAVANADELRTQPISGYLGNDTALVGWADVNEADFPGFQAFAENYDLRPGPMDQVIQLQKALKTVGVERVFAIATFADLTQGGPLAVLPSTPDKVETVQLVMTTIVPKKVAKVVVHGNNVLVGSQQVLDRYTTESKETPNADLIAAVNQIQLPNAVVVQVPAASAMFLSPVLPELMTTLQLNDTTDINTVSSIAMSTRIVSLSASIPPQQAKLKVEMASEETASALAEITNAAMKKSQQTRSLQVKVDAKVAELDLPNKEAVDSAMDGLMTLLSPARASAKQMQRMNSLKQIGLAMHNYYAAYRSLPPQALASKDGKKLLSWRVLILPFLDQNELYQKFKLNEPWDSEHNLKLVDQIPFVYSGEIPSDAKSDGKTRMQTPLRSDSVFGRVGKATSFRDITDGTSNTLMVVEVPQSKAVIWTKPDDITAEGEVNASLFTADGEDGFLVGLCDGSVRKIASTVAAKTLTALLTMNGGEIIDEF